MLQDGVQGDGGQEEEPCHAVHLLVALCPSSPDWFVYSVNLPDYSRLVLKNPVKVCNFWHF